MSFALSVIAKASMILTAAAAASILLSRASAAARHAIWVFAIAGTVLIPLMTAIVPELQLPVLPEAAAGVIMAPVKITPGAAVQPQSNYRAAGLVENGLLALWVAGLALLLVRIAGASLRVSRMAKSARTAEDEMWTQLVQEISKSFRCRKRVRVLLGDADISPMTWGVRRHSILLPSSANDWSVERRRLVLAHELAHVKRSDGIIQVFLQIACSLYWFNPLVWYAAHRVRIERERACDDQVLNLGAQPEDYADHLVQIARGLQAQASASFGAVAMARPSQLETRLVSILDSRARRRAVSKTAMVFLCALTAFITVSVTSIGVTRAIPLPPVLAVTTKPVPQPQPETKTTPAPPQRTHINSATASTVVPPQVIASTGPLYAEQEGTVTLEASVDAQGNVHILRAVKGLSAVLNERAMAEVMNWKFAPALKDGVPVTAITQIDVDFKRADTGEPFHVSADVKPPSVISRVDPQYTDEARSARAQGTVVLEAVVRKDGSVSVRRVVRAVGYGLDDRAIQALQQWVFKPGTRGGVPVDVAVNIEVNFHLREDPPADTSKPPFTLKIDSPQ
jgi:TonB family protein